MLDLVTNGTQWFLYEDHVLVGTFDNRPDAVHALLVAVGEA